MNIENVKWAIPPGLKKCHDDFQILFKTLYEDGSSTQPLMLIGPPGVGKTLFTETFTKAYCTIHKKDLSTIAPINLAAIPETLIDGMLFGWEKGAFTNATKKFDGLLIEAANTSGLAILEEIGELPKSTQAKLLIFIERGYYYKLGNSRPLRLEKPLQIVGTTNQPHKVFRQDFYDRFFPFHIPALHQRRGDILYHFHLLDADLTARWQPFEILLLLSYHWPGNLREIERFIKGAKIEWAKNTSPEKRRWDIILNMDAKYETLSRYDTLSLTSIPPAVSESDKKWLDGILRKYGLSIYPHEKIGPSFAPAKWKNSYQPEGNPAILSKIKDFETAYNGLRMFCILFQQSIEGNFKLLELSKQNRATPLLWATTKTGIPEKDHGRVDMFSAIISEHYDGPVESRYNGLTEDDLLSQYHKELFNQTKGNKSQAARKAGLARSTYCDRLRQLDIE